MFAPIMPSNRSIFLANAALTVLFGVLGWLAPTFALKQFGL